MNNKGKRDLRHKARLICGLANILQYDSENIVNEANSNDYDQLIDTLKDTRVVVQNLMDTVAEMEYAIYLDRMK